jgi:hypothetical protein
VLWGRVLHEASVALLGVPELALDHAERVLDLRPRAGPEVLQTFP